MAEKDTVLNQTYTQLIEKAIADFDAIGGVLVDRGLIANMTNGSVKTEEYAGLMSDYLFTVGNNLTTSGEGGVGVTNIEDKRGSTVAGGASTISYAGTGNVVNFTIKGGALGLYGPNSTLTGSFTGVSAVLTGNLSTVTGVNLDKSGSAYVVTPKENEVIKSLSINKATVTLDVSAEQADGTQSGDATVAFNTGLASGTFTETDPADATSYVAITSTATGEIKGNISATASAKAVTGGYIASKDEIADVSITNTEYSVSVNKSKSLWIKRTSVPELTTATDNTITATAGSGILSTGSTKYIINLASPAITYSGQMEAGYLSANTNVTVTGDAGEGVAYITAGAVGTITKEIGIHVNNKNSLQLSSTQSGAYEIVLNLADGDTAFESKTYTSNNGVAGFVDSGNTTATITGTSKTLKIAKAVENLSGTLTIEGTGDNVFLLNDTGEYKFTVDVTEASLKAISRNVTTEGYVKNADSVTNGITSTAKTFSIRQFAGSLGTSLTSTLVNGEVTDGAGEDASKSAIIFNQSEWDKLDETIKKGDYYKLQSNATISNFRAGYIASNLSDANQIYYLPKAKVQYSVDDDSNEILHVTQGGYLPAGFIGEITNAGKLQQATFTISATTGEDNIIKSKAPAEGENVYRITLDKTVSTAGYIGDEEGTILNADQLYIDHGNVSGTTAAGTISFVAPVAQTIGEVKKYVITASNTSTATISVTEGYVKGTDITVDDKAQTNGGAISITSTGAINLEVATLEIDDAKGVTLTPTTNNVELAETSDYTISAVVADGSTMILGAEAAGYITPEDKTTGIAVDTDTFSTTTKYIKAGTGVTIALTSDQVDKELLQSDFNTPKAEGVAYTISVKSDAVLATDATVGTGYYGATEVAAAKAAQNLNISKAIKAFSVPHGKATITGSGTMSLTADGLSLHQNTGEGYHVITLQYADTTQAATVTEGYIKNGEVVYTKGTATPAATYSIKDTGKYTAEAGNGSENNKQTVITTAGTYATQNITVTLAEDATGSDVDIQLLALQNRLNGF